MRSILSSGLLQPVRWLGNLPLVRFGRGRWPKPPIFKLKHAVSIAASAYVWWFFNGYYYQLWHPLVALLTGGLTVSVPQLMTSLVFPWSFLGRLVRKLPEKPMAFIVYAGFAIGAVLMAGTSYFLDPFFTGTTEEVRTKVMEWFGMCVVDVIFIPIAWWLPDDDDLDKFYKGGDDDLISG